MKYNVETRTRYQEGVSMEDDDCYETAYIVTDDEGNQIMDTTDYAHIIPYLMYIKPLTEMYLEITDYDIIAITQDYDGTELWINKNGITDIWYTGFDGENYRGNHLTETISEFACRVAKIECASTMMRRN